MRISSPNNTHTISHHALLLIHTELCIRQIMEIQSYVHIKQVRQNDIPGSVQGQRQTIEYDFLRNQTQYYHQISTKYRKLNVT